MKNEWWRCVAVGVELNRHLIRQPAAATCLAAARSRSRSDTTPWCHSLRSRRVATRWGRLLFYFSLERVAEASTPTSLGIK